MSNPDGIPLLPEVNFFQFSKSSSGYAQRQNMQIGQINPLAIGVAAFSYFLLGGLWYSPLCFGKAWMRANGFKADDLRRGNAAVIFSVSFLAALVMATNLAFFLADPKTTVGWGATAGALAGVGWAAMAILVLGLFERRPWRWMLINGSYQIVALTLMGLIIGGWRK